MCLILVVENRSEALKQRAIIVLIICLQKTLKYKGDLYSSLAWVYVPHLRYKILLASPIKIIQKAFSSWTWVAQALADGERSYWGHSVPSCTFLPTFPLLLPTSPLPFTLIPSTYLSLRATHKYFSALILILITIIGPIPITTVQILAFKNYNANPQLTNPKGMDLPIPSSPMHLEEEKEGLQSLKV